jgi:hypothetical protein
MHAQGDPKTMNDDPQYGDLVLDVYDFLTSRIAACEASGIPPRLVLRDPQRPPGDIDARATFCAVQYGVHQHRRSSAICALPCQVGDTTFAWLAKGCPIRPSGRAALPVRRLWQPHLAAAQCRPGPICAETRPVQRPDLCRESSALR